jgi:hypothetical protein
VLAALNYAACPPLQLQADQSTSTNGQLQKKKENEYCGQASDF